MSGPKDEAAHTVSEPAEINGSLPDEEKQLPAVKDAPSSGPSAALPPTDTGLQAWMSVFGSFCLLFASFGWITCIGVFQTYYQSHQLKDYSPSTIAWIASLETCVMFIWGPFVGKFFDDHGPRWLLIVGTILHVFGLMMVSLSTEYYQIILAQSICSPTGASFLFFAGVTAVATWFQRHRALAIGITVAGSSLGGVIFPIMVDRLVVQVGFPWTMRICAFLILGLGIIGIFTVTSRLNHTPKPFNVAMYFTPLKEPAFATFAFGYFLFYLGFFVPYDFIILEAQRYGMAPELAAYLVSILSAGGCIGRIVPGYIADRIGRYNMMIIVTAFSAIITLGLWIPGKNNAAIIAYSAFYGASSGAFISLAPAIIAQISPIRELGTRSGTCFAFVAIASLVGNPIAGSVVPNVSVDPFWKLQVFAGMMMVGGTVVIVSSRVLAGGYSVMKVV